MRGSGAAFENRARFELERAGLILLARNYRTRYGELDLVMRDGQTLVFVEVRQRHSASHGGALASITSAKQQRLLRAAQDWLLKHPKHRQLACRFDVIAYAGDGAAANGQWLRGAFEATRPE